MLLRVRLRQAGLGLLAARRLCWLPRASHTAAQKVEYKPIKKVMVANRGLALLSLTHDIIS